MSVVAFIFARGGSKGVKGKNLRLLAGKPLLFHAIEAARAATLVDDVVVSTDDREIAIVGQMAGVKIIMRPAELATDDSPEWLSWQHAIKLYPDFGQGEVGTFVSVPTTAPLRMSEDIDRCIIELRLHPDADAVITVTEARRNPYFNQVEELVGTGHVDLVMRHYWRGKADVRQQAPIVYDATTVAYAVRPEFVLSESGIFKGQVRAVIVPPERAIDIDTELDLRIAEVLMNERGNFHTRPHIRLEPGVCFGAATCRPRLQCWAPAEYYWAGESMEWVLTQWPGNPPNGWPALRREDVLVAAWYLATYDTRTWRKRWGAWAKENADALWHSDWARVTDPPQKEGKA